MLPIDEMQFPRGLLRYLSDQCHYCQSVKCKLILHEIPVLRTLTSRHVCAGTQSKGMYGPLTSLLPRLGAERMLELRPSLIGDTVAAMEVQAVCGAASGLFMAVLRQLQSEGSGLCSSNRPIWLDSNSKLAAMEERTQLVAGCAWQRMLLPAMTP